MFEVILSPDARAFFESADEPLATKLDRCFQRLEQDPRVGNNVKRLSGRWSGYLRYRVGDRRIIYRIDDRARQVLVVLIAHRREVYE